MKSITALHTHGSELSTAIARLFPDLTIEGPTIICRGADEAYFFEVRVKWFNSWMYIEGLHSFNVNPREYPDDLTLNIIYSAGSTLKVRTDGTWQYDCYKCHDKHDVVRDYILPLMNCMNVRLAVIEAQRQMGLHSGVPSTTPAYYDLIHEHLRSDQHH